jgi:hypothetical protein
MFARGVLSFYPQRLHASSCFLYKSFISPTCKITVRNSFVSPTYAKTGGCTPRKMSARRHFLSLFSQSPLSALLLFNHLCTLSFFVSSLSPALPISSALFLKKLGYTPGGHTNPTAHHSQTRRPKPFPLPHLLPLPPLPQVPTPGVRASTTTSTMSTLPPR